MAAQEGQLHNSAQPLDVSTNQTATLYRSTQKFRYFYFTLSSYYDGYFYFTTF